MSIRTSFNPLGTLGGGDWTEVDMSTFVPSNWNDLAAQEPPGLVPCGAPDANSYELGRACTRSNAEGMLYFGFNYHQTTRQASMEYTTVIVPPRNETGINGNAALEFWVLGEPVRLRLGFTLGKTPIRAVATRNDWEVETDWADVEIKEVDGGYTLETPFPARSVLIRTGFHGSSGGGMITKIYKKP